jgi:hypothetical protein
MLDAFGRAVEEALASGEFAFIVAKVEVERQIPFPTPYPQQSERGMKEAFADALRRLPDYQGGQ